MNKTQLVDALAERIGDRRIAANAVDGLLATIVETVQGGDSVSITGFGVFEGRARAARTARNPRTGEAVIVPAATVPAFRPGAGFRSAVSGTDAPRSIPAPRATARATGAATNGTADSAATTTTTTNGAAANGTAAAVQDVPETAAEPKKTAKKKAAKDDKAAKQAADKAAKSTAKAKDDKAVAKDDKPAKDDKAAKQAADKPKKGKKK